MRGLALFLTLVLPMGATPAVCARTAKAFFKKAGGAYEAGERLRQSDLAETLRRIAGL